MSVMKMKYFAGFTMRETATPSLTCLSSDQSASGSHRRADEGDARRL
jgi:hypothetical protein